MTTMHPLDLDNLRVYLHTIAGRLPVFVVTDHPSDLPDFFVARLNLSLPETVAMPLAIMDRDLDRLRLSLESLGLIRLDRSPGDDPVVLEVWM